MTEIEKLKAEYDEKIRSLTEAKRQADAEAAERRAQLKKFEDDEAKRAADKAKADEEEAKKRGEFEKIVAEKDKALETANRSFAQREANMRKRLVDEALRARFSDAIDPEVLALVDRKALEVDPETFEIKGIDDVVKTFREAKPHFFKAADGSQQQNGNGGTSGGGAPPRPNGNGGGNVDFASVSAEDFAKTLAGYGL